MVFPGSLYLRETVGSRHLIKGVVIFGPVGLMRIS